MKRAVDVIEGSDWWAGEFANFTRSLIRLITSDSAIVVEQLGHYRTFAARHGLDFDAYLRDQFAATPEQLEHISALAALAKQKGAQ
jgi:hypothetical protein